MDTQFFPVTLGDTSITLNKHFKPGSKLFLIRVHGDEDDARGAGLWWVHKHGGTFLDVENETREIRFQLGNSLIQVDPNRIFTPKGIKYTLQYYKCPQNSQIISEVRKFSEAILEHCFQKKCIISLHNNWDFNINYFLEGGDYYNPKNDVFKNPQMNPHNCIIVTKKKDFEALKKQNINVVREHIEAITPPGTFSEHCLNAGIRYFNIETFLGEPKKQRELLEIVAKLTEAP